MAQVQQAPKRAVGTAASVGLRRIEQVRLIVGPDGTVAEVTGIAHRYPRTIRIPLAAAARLCGAGVPFRVEHSSPPAPAAGEQSG